MKELRYCAPENLILDIHDERSFIITYRFQVSEAPVPIIIRWYGEWG